MIELSKWEEHYLYNDDILIMKLHYSSFNTKWILHASFLLCSGGIMKSTMFLQKQYHNNLSWWPEPIHGPSYQNLSFVCRFVRLGLDLLNPIYDFSYVVVVCFISKISEEIGITIEKQWPTQIMLCWVHHPWE
jgi:hypothetical protein